MRNRQLPDRPDLRQYRKQAKDLVKAFGRSEQLARIEHHHPRWSRFSGPDPPAFKLADAQLVIAREHGFESWPKFVEHVAALVESRAASMPVASARPGLLSIAVPGVVLDAESGHALQPQGLIVLAHASGSSRYRPASRQVADAFNRAGCNTLSVDLLTDDEELNDGELVHDFRLLGSRLVAIIDWTTQQPGLRALPLGCWATGIGAAATIFAAGERSSLVRALVSSGGRPDLAGSAFQKVTASTLLIASSTDAVGLGFNRFSASIFPPRSVRLEVLGRPNQRFDAPETQSQAIALACDWFRQYLPRKEAANEHR